MSPLPPSISTSILYLSGNFVNRKLEISISKIRVVSISNEFFVFHVSILLNRMYYFLYYSIEKQKHNSEYVKNLNFNYKVWWADL